MQTTYVTTCNDKVSGSARSWEVPLSQVLPGETGSAGATAKRPVLPCDDQRHTPALAAIALDASVMKREIRWPHNR